MSEPENAWDEVVDDLLPAELEWRRLVQTYPLPILTAAAVGGFFVGRQKGPELVSALSSFLTQRVSENVHAMLDGLSGAVRPDQDFDDSDPVDRD